MKPEELESLLRLWGRVFGTAPPREWDEDTSEGAAGATSSLLGKLHVGIGSRTLQIRKPVVWINPETGAVVRQWRQLTARGKETRRVHAPIWNPNPEAERVELAALDLYRIDRLRGVVIRMEYCLRGARQRDKARFVGACEGVERITLRRYRHELDFGRAWMGGRLFGNKVAA
jgi:hypothetical protein